MKIPEHIQVACECAAGDHSVASVINETMTTFEEMQKTLGGILRSRMSDITPGRNLGWNILSHWLPADARRIYEEIYEKLTTCVEYNDTVRDFLEDLAGAILTEVDL